MRIHLLLAWVAMAAAGWASAGLADELDLTDGRKLIGKILEQSGDSVKFRLIYPNGGSADMDISTSDIKATRLGPVEQPKPKVEPPKAEPATPAPPKQPDNGGKPVATDEPEAPEGTPAGPTQGPSVTGAAAKEHVLRSRPEVEALIDKLGKAPPDWWDSVQLNYPNTLDLTWPDKAPGPWDPNKNIGQYYWSIVYENSGKWKEGTRFAHFLMNQFKDDKPKLRKAMLQTATCYGTLLGDYARAAFWYRKADAVSPLDFNQQSRLAECYWKLGCRQMALEVMNKQSSLGNLTIKLLGEMGELPRALDMAKRMAAYFPEDGYMAAGDACRFNGRYTEALDFYKKVSSLPVDPKQPRRYEKVRQRAVASAEAIKLFETLDLKKIPDGTYHGEALGYAGTVKLDVTVAAGKIETIKIVEHHEKQYYTALIGPPEQIIAKQSVKGIDTTTGATITAEAVINAAAKALAGGMK